MGFTGFVSGAAISGTIIMIVTGRVSPLGMFAGGVGALFWAIVAGMAMDRPGGQAGPLHDM